MTTNGRAYSEGKLVCVKGVLYDYYDTKPFITIKIKGEYYKLTIQTMNIVDMSKMVGREYFFQVLVNPYGKFVCDMIKV